jgi:hypothetical protein
MSRGLRILLLAALVGVMIAALWIGRVHRAKAPPPQPPAPMSFARQTPDAKVQLTLAPEIARFPGLRARLYQDGVQELNGFAATAHDDRAHVLAKGLPVPPYERRIAWTLAGSTPKIASARESWFDFTGGAHPNHGSKALIWSPADDEEIERSDLLGPGADQARLDAALCQAIKTAKARRQGAVFDQAEWPCPHWADSKFVLVPSTAPGKIGALDFLFDPYSIGPYVEGEWQVIVPQSAFHADLAAAWAGQFAGEPDPSWTKAAQASG